MSFYADKKREHEKAAEKAYVEKDFATACFHTAKTAEFGLLLAEQSEGKIAQSYIEDAFDLIEIATKMKSKSVAQDKAKTRRVIKEAASENEESESTWELKDKPDMKLDDVAGLDEVKQVLRDDVIMPFQSPEVYERFKQEAGAGVLMYGPPGNGKTFIAKAIAGELDAAFFPVDCAMIKDKYVGETEKNLKKLFAEASSHERAVLFFDEVESLLEKRGNRKINTVTQFLSLTDGIAQSDNCILLLAATNKPWRLDEAAIRPGRLGTHVYVGLPDVDAREAIISYSIDAVPLSDNVDTAELANNTEGYSGADIAEICSRAKKSAIRRQLESGKDEEVSPADFKNALGKISPSVTKANLLEFEKWRSSRDVPVGDAASD